MSFVKEFMWLVHIGYNPLRLIRLALADGHWRAVIASGNGDLYI